VGVLARGVSIFIAALISGTYWETVKIDRRLRDICAIVERVQVAGLSTPRAVNSFLLLPIL